MPGSSNSTCFRKCSAPTHHHNHPIIITYLTYNILYVMLCDIRYGYCSGAKRLNASLPPTGRQLASASQNQGVHRHEDYTHTHQQNTLPAHGQHRLAQPSNSIAESPAPRAHSRSRHAHRRPFLATRHRICRHRRRDHIHRDGRS